MLSRIFAARSQRPELLSARCPCVDGVSRHPEFFLLFNTSPLLVLSIVAEAHQDSSMR